MAAKKKKAAKKTRGRKKTAKRRGGRPAAGQPTKANFIRARLAKGMSAADIVAAGAAEGIEIRPSHVYKLKAKGSSKRSAKTSSARGRKNGKLTAGEFIRQHPGKSASVIVALGKAAGLEFTVSAVYQARSYDRRRSGAAKGGPVRKSRGAAAWTPQVRREGDETAFKKMALVIGFPRAREIVVDLERKWNALLA